MAIGSDDPSLAQGRFDLFMLVAMQEEFRLRPLDISIERAEPGVDFVLAIVDVPRGVVCDEYGYSRKARELEVDFRLLKKIVTARFVFPGAAKATETDSAEMEQVEV